MPDICAFAFMHYFDLRSFSRNFNSTGHHPLGRVSSLISRFQLPSLSLTNHHHSHQSSIHYLVTFYQRPVNLNNKPASQFRHHRPVITHPHTIALKTQCQMLHGLPFTLFFFFLNNDLFLYWLLLGLCCHVRAFSSFGEWRLLSDCVVRASHRGGFSRCRARALGCAGFSSCGSLVLECVLRGCGTWA